MPDKLPRVQKGEPITAEAWNQVVDAVNGSPNVSIMRGKRRAKTQDPPTVSAGNGIYVSKVNNDYTVSVSPNPLWWWDDSNDSHNGTWPNKVCGSLIFDSSQFERASIGDSVGSAMVHFKASAFPSLSVVVQSDVIVIRLS